MIILLKQNPDTRKLSSLRTWLRSMDFEIHYSQGTSTTLMGLVGDTSSLDIDMIRALDVVEEAIRIQEPYKLANRKFHPEDTVVDVAGVKFGDGSFQIIAGPCCIESESQVCEIAEDIKASGASILRGGAYKPRTSPYAFQGLGYEGILDMVAARKKTGLPIVSELMSIDKLDEFEENVDLVQIGARNMQNYDLLKACGKLSKPVLLKRGMSATIEEWIMSAEYIMASGNPNVILCERGIRTFEKYTRNTLDLAVVPIIKEKTHLPIIIDPSHATGDWKYVEAVSLAAIAAGCDGLIVEVHDHPESAWSDGAQSLKPLKFKHLVDRARPIAEAVERSVR